MEVTGKRKGRGARWPSLEEKERNSGRREGDQGEREEERKKEKVRGEQVRRWGAVLGKEGCALQTQEGCPQHRSNFVLVLLPQ